MIFNSDEERGGWGEGVPFPATVTPSTSKLPHIDVEEDGWDLYLISYLCVCIFFVFVFVFVFLSLFVFHPYLYLFSVNIMILGEG